MLRVSGAKGNVGESMSLFWSCLYSTFDFRFDFASSVHVWLLDGRLHLFTNQTS